MDRENLLLFHLSHNAYMFDLLEENISTQDQEVDTEEASARTSPPRSGALFSMPEKFLTKEEGTKKKSHPLIPILSIFIFILVVSSIGLAFAIQNKNLRMAQERAQQEAARVTALQDQQQNKNEGYVSEENIPFQFTEPEEISTSTQSAISLSATSTESATTTFSEIVSGTSTPLVAPFVSSSTSTEQEIVVFGPDTDKDRLSDIEERIYKTDPKKPDTDADGIIDGVELKNLTNPIKGEGAMLKDSGLVSVFTNRTYHFSFFYPNFPDEWAVSALDQTEKEIIASAATGEYISIRVEENPQKLLVLDWYTGIYAVGKRAQAVQTLSFGAWNMLMQENGRVYYLAQKDEYSEVLTPYVYVLTYAANAKKELNYLTTFEMMVRSFSPQEMTVSLQQ
jgi:hypothetical protein